MFRLTNFVGFGAGGQGTPTAGPTDPDISSVVLLAGFDGEDGATAYSDESPAAHGAFAFNGAAQLDTARKKFGSASLLTDGSTSDFLTLADHADWDLGSGEFTIECWANWDVLPSAAGGFLISQWLGAGDQRGWALSFGHTNGDFRFTYTTDGTSGTSVTVASGADDGFVVDTWDHVAVVRDVNTLRIFVKGIQTTTADLTGVTIFNSNTNLIVSAIDNTGGGPMGEDSDAWLDEIRVTKGVARYTTNFTPPTAIFPRS